MIFVPLGLACFWRRFAFLACDSRAAAVEVVVRGAWALADFLSIVTRTFNSGISVSSVLIVTVGEAIRVFSAGGA